MLCTTNTHKQDACPRFCYPQMANMEARGVSNSDNSRKKEIRTRQRASHSCMECIRRKQKVTIYCTDSLAKICWLTGVRSVCDNCDRRYPPVPCTYERFRYVPMFHKQGDNGGSTKECRRSSNYKERMIDLTVTATKFEESDSESSECLSSSCKTDSLPQQTYQSEFQTLQRAKHSLTRLKWRVPVGVYDVPLTSVPPDRNGIQCGDTPTTDAAELIWMGLYYLHPEYDKITRSGPGNIFAGGLASQPLQTLPIESTRHNTELFQFCKRESSS